LIDPGSPLAAGPMQQQAVGSRQQHLEEHEQVEEVASMETLVTIVKRANGNLFDIENYVARELDENHGEDDSAPAVAGS